MYLISLRALTQDTSQELTTSGSLLDFPVVYNNTGRKDYSHDEIPRSLLSGQYWKA